MKLTKINKQAKGNFHGEAAPNALVLENIYPAANELSVNTHQAQHGLRSLLKVYATLFRHVDPFASPDDVKANGVNYGKRVAVFITKNAVPFTMVRSTLRELVDGAKADALCDGRLFSLACDLLASDCRNVKSDYTIS